VDELQQDVKAESDSLKQMRKLFQKDCSILQDEILKDEMRDKRLGQGCQEQHATKSKAHVGISESLAYVS
jgi:hypothetical protein